MLFFVTFRLQGRSVAKSSRTFSDETSVFLYFRMRAAPWPPALTRWNADWVDLGVAFHIFNTYYSQHSSTE